MHQAEVKTRKIEVASLFVGCLGVGVASYVAAITPSGVPSASEVQLAIGTCDKVTQIAELIDCVHLSGGACKSSVLDKPIEELVQLFNRCSTLWGDDFSQKADPLLELIREYRAGEYEERLSSKQAVREKKRAYNKIVKPLAELVSQLKERMSAY